MADMLADDICLDDRRRVVNAGVVRGRDVEIANLRAIADAGVENMTSTAIAVRGERLILHRVRFLVPNWPEDSDHGVIEVVEITADNQASVHVVFDPDDFDSAIAELDARYLAGEASAHPRAWSVLVDAVNVLNRHEVPAATPDYVVVDHQLHHTTVEAGALTEYLRVSWDLTPDLSMYIEAVHKLSDLGAVMTLSLHGTSQEGLDADWRIIEVLTMDSGVGNRCEIFDEADLDAALARFAELHQQERRLENAATQWLERYLPHFAARDWVAMADMLAEDLCVDDRRRVINGGVARGRDIEIASVRAIAEVVGVENITSTTIATRGEHLVLHSLSFFAPNWPDEFNHEVIEVLEITDDGKGSVHVVFDPDDFDSAIAELDARYLAGEAADHARTWTAITKAYAALNRHEMPATPPDFVDIDHRKLAAIGSGDLAAYIRAAFEDLTPQATVCVEAVHRLSELGAVVTHDAHGISHEGIDAEWRMIGLYTVAGDLINRIEIFDETDLDDALAKFEELSRPPRRLENSATRVIERVQTSLTAHDWDAIAEIMADDISDDDRRRAVNAGIRRGPQAEIDNMRAIADLGATVTTSDVIATRGERLALVRFRLSIRDQEAHCVRLRVAQHRRDRHRRPHRGNRHPGP